MKRKRVPRAGQEDVAFPKMTTEIVSTTKKAKTPEAVIQAIVDMEIKKENIPSLRLSDHFFRAVFANPQIPIHIKKILKTELAGWADNILFLPINKKFCLSAFVENKTEIGKLTGMQKIRSKELPYNICRSKENIQILIKQFKFLTERLKEIEIEWND